MMIEQHARVDRGPVPADRYAELTYSSFDDGISGGGWQVKQVRGRLTDQERDALQAQVATHLDPGVELPRVPTPEQIAAFPRRLAYAPVGAGFADGAAAWWHTAPAGADASGRPGNVFSHVVLDRHPTAAPVFRPIDLWRSPTWLTPYGPDQVASADLADTLPVPGNGVDTAALIDFAFADFDTIAVLGPLLDACAAALAGGPAVLLAVNDLDHAACWIAAVSRLTDPRTARQLYFSTLERIGGVAEALQRGVRLLCLPISDLDGIDHVRRRIGAPTVLIGEDEFPELGDLGSADEPAHPHVTEHGDRIAVTAWSVLARVVLEAESDEQARSVLDRLDPISEQVAPLVTDGRSVGYSPDWPLAMAVAQQGEVFAEAQPEAARVIGRHSPRRLDQRPDLYAPAAAAIATQCGTSTADAWQQLRPDPTAGPSADSDRSEPSVGSVLIFDSYLRRAILDEDWLTRADGVPLPDPVPTVDAGRLAEVVDQQLQALLQQTTVEPVLVARLAELLVRAGLADESAVARLSHLADAYLTPALTGDGAEALVRRIGPVSEQTLDRVIRPGLVIEPPVPTDLGRMLPATVLAWLYPQRPAPITLRALHDAERAGTLPGDYWLRAERDWRLVRTGELDADERPYAVWTMLDASERVSSTDAWRRPVIDWTPCLPLVRRPTNPDDLGALLHRYQPDRRIATEVVAATVLTVPWSGHRWSSAVRRLCQRAQQPDHREVYRPAEGEDLPQVRQWLADRSWATAWWSTRTAAMINTVRAWSRRTDLPAPAQYAPDIRTGMAAVLMVELIFGRAATALAPLLDQFGPAAVAADQDLMDQLSAVINAGEKERRDRRAQRPPALVGIPQALAAVMRGDPEVLEGRICTDGGRWLAGFRVRQTPLLEVLLGSWLARIDDRDRLRNLRSDTVTVLTAGRSEADNGREWDKAVGGKIRDLRRHRGGS